jgi:hypothetical protein
MPSWKAGRSPDRGSSGQLDRCSRGLHDVRPRDVADRVPGSGFSVTHSLSSTIMIDLLLSFLPLPSLTDYERGCEPPGLCN